MSLETKEDVLNRILNAPVPICPHCGEPMKLWEEPPVNFSDGLGWGEPYLYMCFNNQCPPFVSGWAHFEENHGHCASTRCFCYPSSGKFEFMPVFSKDGGTGQIIDEEMLEKQEQEKIAIKEGFVALAQAYADRDNKKPLELLLDAASPPRVRLKAADMLEELGDETSLEPMLNKKFGNRILDEAMVKAIKAIQERTFTRECPYCAEIIKVRAKVCKHCGKNPHE
ncbi:MAG: zinc ribbon domain-containing protein [Desulfatibacillum sp.]|nr:zinc ribbon domain-containing protein [Desulfatibacillum sp.]